MGVDVRAHLDFLDLDDLLVLARFSRFLLGRVFQLAQIKDLGDWRCRIRRNFNQIEPGIFSDLQRFID